MAIRTSERQAQVLELNYAPSWMIQTARENYDDECKSELAFPLRQLVADSHNIYIPCILPWIVTHNRRLRYSNIHTELNVNGVTLKGRLNNATATKYKSTISTAAMAAT